MPISDEDRMDLDDQLTGYVDDMDFQLETLRDRFNNAAADNRTKDKDLVPMATACAVLGKALFEIKTSPAYAALIERTWTGERLSTETAKPSGMG